MHLIKRNKVIFRKDFIIRNKESNSSLDKVIMYLFPNFSQNYIFKAQIRYN